MSASKPQILNCYKPGNTSLGESPNGERKSEHMEQQTQEVRRGDGLPGAPHASQVTVQVTSQLTVQSGFRDPGYSLEKERVAPWEQQKAHPRGRSTPASPQQELQRRGQPSAQASQLRGHFAEAPGPRPSPHHGQASAGGPCGPIRAVVPRSGSGFSFSVSPPASDQHFPGNRTPH